MATAKKEKIVKRLVFDLRNCAITEKQVRPYSDTSSQLYLPKEWENKTVIVVLKDGK